MTTPLFAPPARLTAALLGVCLCVPAWSAQSANAGNGTVTDSTTGLVWDQCAYGRSGSTCATGTAFEGTWAAALGVAVTANAANYKGFNDWRVPNVNELESLVKIDSYIPAIDGTVFPHTPATYFWSSTSLASDPSSAWTVYFNDGGTSAGGKASTFYVRLVRSGQSLASFDRLTDTAPAVTPTPTTGADCFFNWAENYPELFAPAGAPTQTAGIYSYRYYAGTNAYLGVSNADQHAYYVGRHSNGTLMDLGTLTSWNSSDGCR